MQWMAVALCTGEGFDLLVRTGQHSAIRQAEIPQFKRVGEEFYISLWPENIFGLAVDGVPHVCCWNAVLVESQFYPHPIRDRTYPRLLSDEHTRFVPKDPDQSPPPIRPKRTPVYIPTIPRYLDACLYRSKRLKHLPDAPRFRGSSDIDIYYLIRYLFLETDTQRAKLLPMLAEPRRSAMRDTLDRFKRTVKANIRLRWNSDGVLTSSPEVYVVFVHFVSLHV